MKILNDQQIRQKTVRLAIQIAEENHLADEIHLLGINNNGYEFSKLLQKQIRRFSQAKIYIARLSINPADPLKDDIKINKKIEDFENKVVIIVDDVANTGRTIFYAIKPLLTILPQKVEVAVLVDRKHKLFPIQVDYMGLSLATTMRENIQVRLIDVDKMEVHLD